MHGNNFGRANIIADIFIPYYSVKKGLKVRFYGGAFLYKTSSNFSPYKDFRLKLSATDGNQDVMYNDFFIGRNETYPNFLKQQIIVEEGGFKTWFPFGRTSDWATSINLTSTIPGIIPIKIFADMGTYENAKKVFSKAQFITYDAGIQIDVVPKIIEIYIPLIIS